MLWVDIGDITQITLFDILLDWVHFFFGGDFHFGIGPAGHFDDHVVDFVARIAWDIMKGSEGFLVITLKLARFLTDNIDDICRGES